MMVDPSKTSKLDDSCKRVSEKTTFFLEFVEPSIAFKRKEKRAASEGEGGNEDKYFPRINGTQKQKA